MSKEMKKKPLKVLSASGFAALMVGTTVVSPFTTAHAETNDDSNGKNDPKTEDSKAQGFNVDVGNKKLEEAVKNAKDAGVKVTKKEDVSKTVSTKDADKTKKEMEEDIDKQIKDLEDKTKQAKDQSKSDDSKKKDYESKKAAYDKKYAQYKKDLDAYNKEKKQYEKDMKKHDEEVKTIKEENDKAKKDYENRVNKEKDIIKKASNNPSQPSYVSGASKRYTKSGSWTNLKGQTLDKDIHVAATGDVNSYDDLQNGKFAIHAYSDSNKIKNSNIIQRVSWGNTKPTGPSSLVKGDKITEDAHKKVPGYTKDMYDTSGKNNKQGKTTQLWSVKPGQWVTIPKAIHLADGTTKDLKVKFDKNTAGKNLRYGGDWVTFWNEGGAINYYDGSADLGDTPPKDKITATYKVSDKSNSSKKYLWTGSILDIDAGQQLEMNGSDYSILAMGGGLHADSNVKTIKSDNNLGKTWGKNHNEANFLDGTKSVPDGTIVFARYANEISHSLANTGVQKSTLVANGDFGSKVNTNIAEYPKLKKIPPKPKEPGNPPKKPVAPTPPESSKDIKTEYHLNNLKVTPSNHKDVENGVTKIDTDKSIDTKEVNVGDTITYPLDNSALPANRTDDVKSYKVYDEVPKEVQPNEEEIKKNIDTKLWDVKVDGQKVTFSATKDLLSDMNKDKSKAFKINDLPIVGTVVKATDKPFENEFTTTIGTDGDHDMTVKSNKVKNKTPKPVESKIHKYIIDNGKLVEKNEVNQGDNLKYQGDIQFSNTSNAKSRSISDQLDKERLDLNDVKVYMSKDDAKGMDLDDNKSDNEKSDSDKDQSSDDKQKEDDKDSSKADTAKDDSEDTSKDKKDNESSDKDSENKEQPSDKSSEKDESATEQAGEVSKDDNSSDKEDSTSEEKGDSTSKSDKDQSETKDSKDEKSDDASDNEKTTTKTDKDGTKTTTTTEKEGESTETASSSESEASTKPFDTKSGVDVTNQGDLKLNKDDESFTWTAKDPKKFAGKKVTVVIDSTVKKDAKGEIDNVIKMKEDDKGKDSNKVVSVLKEKPKKEETPPTPSKPNKPEKETPKEQPKETPKTPEKEQPKTPETPEKEQPTVKKVDKDLPSTGSDLADFGIIGGFLAAVAGASLAILKMRKNSNSDNE